MCLSGKTNAVVSVSCVHNFQSLRRGVYLGAEPRETPDAADTSLPSLRSSAAACASRTTSSPRTSFRRPRWPGRGTGRSSAASGSTPRFPCWTLAPPHRLRQRVPSLLLETYTSTFNPPAPHFPTILLRLYDWGARDCPGVHYFNFKAAAQTFAPLQVKLPLRFVV